MKNYHNHNGAPNNNITYYQLILDSSGSMQSAVEETIGAFNEQIQAIKALQKKFPDQEFRVSLTTFNSSIDFNFDALPAKEVPELTPADYRPNSETALLDAMGDTIQRLEARAEEEIRADKATAVVVTLTDGYENASQRYSYAQVAWMIDHLQKGGNWTFTFLGADLDVAGMAERLNIRRESMRTVSKATLAREFCHISDDFEDYATAKSMGTKKKDLLR